LGPKQNGHGYGQEAGGACLLVQILPFTRQEMPNATCLQGAIASGIDIRFVPVAASRNPARNRKFQTRPSCLAQPPRGPPQTVARAVVSPCGARD